MKNILLLGAGGRECALAWKLSQSENCGLLYIAPGNAGTAEYGINLPISTTDFVGIKNACFDYKIDILIPANEEPLVAGINDFIKAGVETEHIIVVGPTKEAAQLEGSKAFSKKFMLRHNIPTAAYHEFTNENFEQGIALLKRTEPPYVIKADGLAAGKGVVITSNVFDAIKAFRAMIKDCQFGEASKKVVIEEYLDGIELSVFVLADGENYLLLPNAKDYKRIGEKDTGLNTGGMGAISPVPFADDIFMQKVIDKIIEPTLKGLREEHIEYTGFLFFGLISVNNEPFVIEYNCRLGDPETEVIMPRIKNDLVDLILKMSEKKLQEVSLQISKKNCAAVMLVAHGYPSEYPKGHVITGIEDTSHCNVFHSGTIKKDRFIVTNGGRVMAMSSADWTLQGALSKCYDNIQKINYEGKYYRKDIGFEFI